MAKKIDELMKPPQAAMIYEDERVYACLASYPLAPGHTIVVWKKPVTDLHFLGHGEYEHLMAVVDRVRRALLVLLKIEKVYLMYLDEVHHVHWQLIPAYNQEGFNVLHHRPRKVRDFVLAKPLRAVLN